MPLTDAMEKAATAERTAGPIAVFSNSYARLPDRFFARLAAGEIRWCGVSMPTQVAPASAST